MGIQDWLWEPCSQADMGKNIPARQKLLLLGSAVIELPWVPIPWGSTLTLLKSWAEIFFPRLGWSILSVSLTGYRVTKDIGLDKVN